jgi:hypothetical protein
MPYLMKIFLVVFLCISLVFCNEKSKAKRDLAKLDFYLEKGFVSDTFSYESMYFKMRITNSGSNAVRLFLEKYEIPYANIFNRQPLKKSGSIIMQDPAGNRLNELFVWPLYPAEVTIKPNRQIEFMLKSSIKGLVNADLKSRSSADSLQSELLSRIKYGRYCYYSLNDNGVVIDSNAIHINKDFSIAFLMVAFILSSASFS